jgi:regulator of cell morphogenesis and NO signaling
LVSHFAKEESILFPMAENMFSEEEKQELAARIKLI